MKNYKYLIAFLFLLSLVMGAASGSVSTVRAQSEEDWTDPVNLSNSGSSVNPSVLVDSKGTIHAFWLDEFNGYQYVNSPDGVTWSAPQAVKVPFSLELEKPSKPLFLSGTGDVIHILWLDPKGTLQYRRSSSNSLGSPLTWSSNKVLTDSAVRFDAKVDSKGTLHVGYIKNIEEPNAPAGIYYNNLSETTWSAPELIYPSKYYRSFSLKAGNEDSVNLQLALSDSEEAENVYLAWDDRSQKRIFLAKSPDGGNAWDGTFEVRGPDDVSGLEMPYNIDLGASGDQVLLTWQAGTPGSQCIQYSQWSTDGAKTFGQPVKVLENFTQCPQSSQFLTSDKDLSIVLFNTLGDLSLVAWDGERWSTPLPQSQIASFTNPATLDNVILGCQNVYSSKEKIYLVGCDTGQAGDIWFTTRPIGSVESWFPPSSEWTMPSVLADFDQEVLPLSAVTDRKNNIHAFWIQPASNNGAADKSTIQYSRWTDGVWSEPTTVLTGVGVEPIQLNANVNGEGRAFLFWVDGKTGDMLFSWANADNANKASEWKDPQYIPVRSVINSSPDILVDDLGTILAAYAVPINEQRGIYFIESNDGGNSWSQPFQVFDAVSADWDMVDQPKICITKDSRLHVLFTKYTVLGEERQPQGLYYTQSSNGGASWSEPEVVSENAIQGSDISCSGQQTIHRVWQEENESYFVYLDQVSNDGGTTWDSPVYVTGLNEKPTQGTLTTAADEQIYFVQLLTKNNLMLQEWKWDSNLWNLLDTKELSLAGSPIPSSVAAGITPNGGWGVLISTENQDAKATSKYQLIGLSRNLQLPENASPSTGAIIPTPGLVDTASDPAFSSLTPVTTPSLANLEETPTRKNLKNVLGFALVAGILLIMAILFRPWSGKKGEKKK